MKLLPLSIEVESKTVLRKAALAHKALAELKGVIATIPNENILNETLTLREARESSAIENIISTFDEVYQSNLIGRQFASPEAKEVHLYAKALKIGFELVQEKGLLTVNHILQIQEVLIKNNAGFRKLPGTKLLNDRTGEIIYTPPQNHDSIIALMKNLEEFINNDEMLDTDPLIKMAIIHHQFESIHPFYDGNGRTGRIINILYLIQKELLEIPVLYLSRFIIQNKSKYYSLLQKVREENAWEEWILYMLDGVEQTAHGTILLINRIREQMQSYKEKIQKELPKIYSHELLENLFKYPYTKIEYLQKDIKKSRNTAISYLEDLVKRNFLIKEKRGRDNFYINKPLFDLLADKNNNENQLKKYKGISGNNGITSYKILEKGIILEFKYKDLYLYDYIKPGKKHVEQMKILAESGKGLTTYINQNVRDNYKEKVNDMIEVNIQYKELIELLCKAIKQRRLLKIYYKSNSSGERWREIRPYMIWENQKKNLSLAGVPIEELRKTPKEKRNSGQYLLTQLIERLRDGEVKLLSDTFNDPEVPRRRVDDTQTKVVCRFIYDDEDKKEVKKQWLKVKYIK